MIRGRLALAARLPPGVVARRLVGRVAREVDAVFARRRDRHAPTYAPEAPDGPVARRIRALPMDLLHAEQGWIGATAGHYLQHRFDLLGSGWSQVAYGMTCRGIEGHRYPPDQPIAADPQGHWLAPRINAANLAESQRIWGLVDRGYVPIDWQLDFKSGHRWREDTWYRDVVIAEVPGSDVKVPWELARMQHLPVLAWACALAGDGVAGLAAPEVYAREFRNQILDFAATNPPRFGVNWYCAMDVAIRAANWCLAYDLFRAAGAGFDPAFEAILKRGLLDHGRHILSNLEWYPEGRGNHYLADVVGLLFIACALPPSAEADAWLDLAARELVSETAYQFGADGGNFEASTCYHRLAGDLAVFGTALLRGVPEARRAGTRPGPDHMARLERMAEFSRDITKPDGRVPQIGDNDSGRLFKLHPVYTPMTVAEARRRYANLEGYAGLPDAAGYLDEDGLDQRSLVAAIAALVARPDLQEFAGAGWLDAAVVQELSGGAKPDATVAPGQADAASRLRIVQPFFGVDGGRKTEIVAPGGNLRDGLRLFGYPDFGLWVFRSSRLFLAVRCGPIGNNGRGAHAHNDQLAIELTIDGEDWIADPGAYLYTPSPGMRNAYRSVEAHSAPRWEGREPGRLDLGLFWLGDEAQARCLAFGEAGFLGEHRGYGVTVRRQITLAESNITVVDSGLPDHAGGAAVRCVGRAATVEHFAPAVPCSPGYGKQLRASNAA